MHYKASLPPSKRKVIDSPSIRQTDCTCGKSIVQQRTRPGRRPWRSSHPSITSRAYPCQYETLGNCCSLHSLIFSFSPNGKTRQGLPIKTCRTKQQQQSQDFLVSLKKTFCVNSMSTTTAHSSCTKEEVVVLSKSKEGAETTTKTLFSIAVF